MPEQDLELQNVRRSQAKEVWRRLKKNKLAMIGLVMMILLILVAIFADQLAPYPYNKQDYNAVFETPSRAHPFGTDEYGRDILSRVIHGSRISLRVGFVSLLYGSLVGCIVGAVAGFFGGAVDNVLMRICDVFAGIPQMVLAIAIASTLGPGIDSALIAVSVGAIPSFARVVRAATMTVRDQEYVEAAYSLGANKMQIIFTHIFPNILAPIIVQATLGIATSILLCASAFRAEPLATLLLHTRPVSRRAAYPVRLSTSFVCPPVSITLIRICQPPQHIRCLSVPDLLLSVCLCQYGDDRYRLDTRYGFEF